MTNTEIIEKALVNLNQATALLIQWKTKSVIPFEEQKKAVTLWTLVLSEIMAVDYVDDKTISRNSELVDELQILKEHKDDLKRALTDLRNELYQRAENINTTIATSDTETAIELDEEKNIQRLNRKKTMLTTDVHNPSILDTLIGHTASDPALPTPIDSLRKAIGISDKFLFMKELFNNNDNAFQMAIETLDNQHTLEEAQKKMTSLLQHADYNGDAYRQLNILLIRRYKKGNE